MDSHPQRSGEYYELTAITSPSSCMTPPVMESVKIGTPPPAIEHFNRKEQPAPPVCDEPTAPINANSHSPSPGVDGFLKTSFQAGSTPPKIDQNTAFWEAYNKAGDLEDKEFVKTASSDLDSLLIFAGLFSATNTAFIIESYKTLKVDPADKTNELLQSLLVVIQNPSATVSATSFVASSRDIRVNAYFFTSLCCALSAAFAAVLAKQWLTQYDQDRGGSLKSSAARGRERQRKYEGRGKWHLEDVIVMLPTILQFSLFFFFVGLVDFLWPLNNIATSISIGFSITVFLFYATTLVISIVDDSSPFQTRLSFLLRSPAQNLFHCARRFMARATWRGIVSPGLVHAKLKESVDISCFFYLFDRMSKPEDVRIFADALPSLLDGIEVVLLTNSFVDLHLKPLHGRYWSLPTLYGPGRSPLLRILNILIKAWRNWKLKFVQTPFYFIDLDAFSKDIPGELRRAFLADPADTESFHCIIDILFTLEHLGNPPSTPGQLGIELTKLWLGEDVTKNLEHKDPVAQQNTLTLLALVSVTLDCAERIRVWNIVNEAKERNPSLKRFAQPAGWGEILMGLPDEAQDTLSAFVLLEWASISGDVDVVAEMLETLPGRSGNALLAAGALVETLFTFQLKPTLDGWWHLPGLHGENKTSILRILHTIIVRWKYPEAESSTEDALFQIHPFVSSLRAELWKAFLATPQDSGVVNIIVEICKNLPTPTPIFLAGDSASTAALKMLNTAVSALLESERESSVELHHGFSLLLSNVDSLASLPCFNATRLALGSSHAITSHLRATMWNTDSTADLEDFWRATLRAQILLSLPSDLHSLGFARYLDLWFRHYTKLGAELRGDCLAPRHPEAYIRLRIKQLFQTYTMSLHHLLTGVEAPIWSQKLTETGHYEHLLEIIHTTRHLSYSTTSPLALHLFLRLWFTEAPSGRSESSYLTVSGVREMLGVLSSGSFSPDLILLNVGVNVERSLGGEISHQRLGLEVSDRVNRIMGDMRQTTRWLYAYLKAAVQNDLVHRSRWKKMLRDYASWCGEMDRRLGTEEYGRLSQSLREIAIVFFRDLQEADGREDGGPPRIRWRNVMDIQCILRGL